MFDCEHDGVTSEHWPAWNGWIGCLFLCLVLSSGCGRPSYQLETAPVRGTVTLDGKPLPSGYVFVATERGRMAKGTIQPDGTFTLSTYSEGDGVQVGTHSVIVTPVPPDESAVKRVPIPARYGRGGTSGLKIEVKSGEEHEIDLNLTTDEKK